jgi:hypothetical protein
MASPRHRAPVLIVLTAVCLALGGTHAPAQEPHGAGGAGATAAHRPRRNLGPSPIRLAAPDTSVALLSLMPAEIAVPCAYTGSSRLTFSMPAGPAGMTIDAETGTLRWTPPAAAEGTQPAVRIRAGDGSSSAEVSFTVRVATTQPVSKSLAGSTLTVTQPGTLNGLAFTFPAQTSVPPAQVTVATISAGQAPPLPPDVTRVSDFFRVTPVQGSSDMFTVTLPTTGLPAGRKPEELRLFVYTDAAANVKSGGEIAGPAWLRTWYGLDVMPSGRVTIQLQGLGELSFIGLDPPVTPVFSGTGPRVGAAQVRGMAVPTTCVSLLHSNFTVDLNRSLCVVQYGVGKSFTVIVKNFGAFHPSPAASLDDLLGWLAAGRTAFDGYGLVTDPVFEVVIESMPQPTWLGFVTTANLENRRTLHLTSAPEARADLQGTAVHEYFHQAQARTPTPGKSNAINSYLTDWLIEGTARWVEDDVFDHLNTYALSEYKPLSAILPAGLAARPDDEDAPTRAYARWAFWKMVESSCSGFSIPQLLGHDTASDPRGIVNLKQNVESAGWQCDFGAGFGEANRSTLASALLFYSYATEKENNLALLDSNEPSSPFERAFERLAPSPDCTSWTSCPDTSLKWNFVNPAGVGTYRVTAVTGLSPGQSVTLNVESVDTGKELWVWVGDNEVPGGLSSGSWYRSTGTIKHTYGGGNRAPETIIFVVNPDPKEFVNYRIRASIDSTFFVFSNAPTFAAGPPGHDLTLQALNLQPWPASYSVVWTFGHGSGDITVTNAQTVTHRWPAVGDYPVTATLHSLPDNTVRAYAAATARIRYFGGRFTMSQFSGSASGCFWESNKYPDAYAAIAANPSTGELDLDLKSPDRTVPEEAVLRAYGTGAILLMADDDPANTAPRCEHALVISGNTYLARFANGGACDGWAATCIEVRATQSGDRIEGTISHLDTACRLAGSTWVIHCQGNATSSFTGTWTSP